MKIARILYPVKNLGPGNRIGIWMSGCNRACKGCANPELWEDSQSGEVSLDVIKQTIHHLKDGDYPLIDGVTISGGEPFLQPEALAQMVDLFLEEGIEDVLVFTGFYKEELEKNYEEILEKIAVLIDGPYEEEKNDGHPLRGSANQTIYFLKERYMAVYEKYILDETGKHHVQLFPLKDGKVATGIHKKDFREEYHRRIQSKV